MRRTLKVLSALLTYPTAELQAAVPEMRLALAREARLPPRNRDRLDRVLAEIATGDLYDLQERYILLFDRTRSLSLHLFEHVHGESRDRGQAMVDHGSGVPLGDPRSGSVRAARRDLARAGSDPPAP